MTVLKYDNVIKKGHVTLITNLVIFEIQKSPGWLGLKQLFIHGFCEKL